MLVECTPFDQSFLYSDPNYAVVGKILLTDIGVNNTVSHLTSASTLFAPNNDALLSYNKAADVNPAEPLTS